MGVTATHTPLLRLFSENTNISHHIKVSFWLRVKTCPDVWHLCKLKKEALSIDYKIGHWSMAVATLQTWGSVVLRSTNSALTQSFSLNLSVDIKQTLKSLEHLTVWELSKRKDLLFNPCTSLQMCLMTAVDVQLAHSNRIISLRLPVFITIAWRRGRFYSSGQRYIIYRLETIEGALY